MVNFIEIFQGRFCPFEFQNGFNTSNHIEALISHQFILIFSVKFTMNSHTFDQKDQIHVQNTMLLNTFHVE
jgi:hypothetical protein